MNWRRSSNKRWPRICVDSSRDRVDGGRGVSGRFGDRRGPSRPCGVARGRVRQGLLRLRRACRSERRELWRSEGQHDDSAWAEPRRKIRPPQVHSRIVPARLGTHSGPWRPDRHHAGAELLPVRADIGMLFQESALFDSLTVAENVGYRLNEETDMPEDQVRSASRRSWVSSGSRNTSTVCRRSCPAASGAAWRSPRDGRQADPPALRRPDNRPRSDYGDLGRRRIVKLRDLEQVTSIVVTHQIRDAFYVPATPRACAPDGRRADRGHRRGRRQARGRFMVLHDGRIHVRGERGRPAHVRRPLLFREFLFMTLPPW